MRMVLYQPEIAQNVGTILRTCACFGVHVDILGPIGFPFDHSKMQRAGMDYIEKCSFNKFSSWEEYKNLFLDKKWRIIATTPAGSKSHHKFAYKEGDIILFGSESTGLPEEIIKLSDEAIRIPMIKGLRSLNLAISCGIILGSALSSLGVFDNLS